MTALKVVGGNESLDTLKDACEFFYEVQGRIKELNAEKEELRISSGFAATILRDAVVSAGQQQKKFGDYTVHLGESYDVFCKGCGTFATSCGCESGPVEVHAIFKSRIWVKKAGEK